VKKREEETPLAYFERSYLVIVVFIALTGLFGYLSVTWISEFDPEISREKGMQTRSLIGVLMAVPAVVLAFQTLWLILNPYALIYEDKFEIKKSFFSSKIWYFLDIKKVSESSPSGFDIVYNDDDAEKVSVFGIRTSHKQKFRDAVNHYVCKSLVERDD